MKPQYTIGELLTFIEENYSNPKALVSYEHESWHAYSTEQMLEEIKYIALGLKSLGIEKGTFVGLIAPSSARWTMIDLAIMSIGAVSVGLFLNVSEENFRYEVELAEIKTIFVEGSDAWLRHDHCKDHFNLTIALDDEPQGEKTITYQALLARGRELYDVEPDLFKSLLQSHTPDTVAAVIFTSGSTGTPKGAVHTHQSLISLFYNDSLQWDSKNDIYLSILPLAHILARSVSFIMVMWGISIYYYNDLKNLGVACREVHPTVMVVVPRLLEKVYSKMVANVEAAGYLKRTIGEWAFDLANQETETTWKHLFHGLADKLVYSHLREALGGKLRLVISGGAALDPHLNHFLGDIGIAINEGWGLTEACPVCVNPIGKTKLGSIGTLVEGMEIMISPIGEILIRGPLVMKEYLKNPEATAQAIDAEGWLHTGDKGTIDEEGYAFIIGRLKELIKTSNGEMIAPVPIEHALTKAPFIETAIIIAERRKFVSALLVPNFEYLHGLKNNKNMSNLSDEDFLNSSYIKSEMEQLLNKMNQTLNHWEQIHAYRFIMHPLSIENGELTPSMKIIRETIEKNYKSLIDSIYQEEKK
ncbi:MAG: long-chain fatty acid--CoA ligase [Parachlamydiales bacterium]